MSTPLLPSSPIFWLLVVLFAAWAGFWKTIALWFSARNSEKAWFIVFALVSLAGFPEIYYLRSRRCWPFKPKEPDEEHGAGAAQPQTRART